MFNTILYVVNCYFIALFSFLVFLKKGFLMFDGNDLVPSINLTFSDEQIKNNIEDEAFINDGIK